jgi:hypothetical protein
MLLHGSIVGDEHGMSMNMKNGHLQMNTQPRVRSAVRFSNPPIANPPISTQPVKILISKKREREIS